MPRRRSMEEEEEDEEERPQRNAANARERARMRVLSRAFCRLKTTLPWVPPDTKLSKLDTLRWVTRLQFQLGSQQGHGSLECECLATFKVRNKKNRTIQSRSNVEQSLRLATSYIAHLRRVLHGPQAEPEPPSPLNLSWPFSFQQQTEVLTPPSDYDTAQYPSTYFTDSLVQIG